VTCYIGTSISAICCARMLLNIRDVMTLSDPKDTMKPNPWSLESSFDVRYGLGGMNEITLDYMGSNVFNIDKPDLDDNGSLNVRTAEGNNGRSDAGDDDATRRARGDKFKARDEESGADAALYDRDIMLGLGGFGE
jgi:hypothetical protein